MRNSCAGPHGREQTSRESGHTTFYSRLLKENIILLGTPDRRHGGQPGDAQMLFPGGGGSATGYLAVYQLAGWVDLLRSGDLDTMRFVEPDIVTICVGQAASMERCCWRRQQGQAVQPATLAHPDPPASMSGWPAGYDIDIYAREILRMRES